MPSNRSVEGQEWPIFASMSTAALRSFRQISFEFHGITTDGRMCRDVPRGKSYWFDCWKGVHNVSETVRFMKRLNKYFVLVSNHGNNWWSAHEVAGHVIPDMTELTYVNRNLLPDTFSCIPLPSSEINRDHVRNTDKAPEIETLAEWSGAPQGMVRARGASSAKVRPVRSPQALKDDSGRAANRWAALEGRRAEEIIQQHADPLGALARGEIPAIILRRHLDPASAAEVVDRLAQRHAHG